MSAYTETLLHKVQDRLSDMMDYAVNDLKIEPDVFFQLFATSKFARRIEAGDKILVYGRSGIELAQDVLLEKTDRTDFSPSRPNMQRTPAYWAGWIIAYYQWRSEWTFLEISEALPFTTVMQMYKIYHEAPEDRFADAADRIMAEKHPETRLRRIRNAYGCSQSELAKASGVGLRSIQLYEQRKKNINHAEAWHLKSLAQVLGCSIEDLFEPTRISTLG